MSEKTIKRYVDKVKAELTEVTKVITDLRTDVARLTDLNTEFQDRCLAAETEVFKERTKLARAVEFLNSFMKSIDSHGSTMSEPAGLRKFLAELKCPCNGRGTENPRARNLGPLS